MHRAAATLESVWDATGTEGGRGRARIVSQKLDEIFCVDSFYLNSFEMKSSLERIRRRDDTRETEYLEEDKQVSNCANVLFANVKEVCSEKQPSE